jgi:DinB family protein
MKVKKKKTADVLRTALAELLTGGHAHAAPKDVLSGVSAKLRGKRPKGLHSVWEELEHLRRAQEDILRYTLDPSWTSPPFPAGYWPRHRERVSDEAWNASVSGFLADLEEVVALARDGSRGLTDEIPHGEGRTYLRQVLLVADHNAYHLGQIVAVRKLLGDWK